MKQNWRILSVGGVLTAALLLGGTLTAADGGAVQSAAVKAAETTENAKAADERNTDAGKVNAPENAKKSEELTIDWMGEIVKGGLTSLALILLSAAAVGFAAERFFNLRDKKLIPEYYAGFFRQAAAARDTAALVQEAEKRPSVVAALGAFIGENPQLPHDRMENELLDLAGWEFERHRQRSYPLAIIATMAPMLGLLGTMIGMIEAFQKVAILGDTGDASVLADSIGKALITTAVGLVLAIPALGCYHYLKTKVSLAELKVEETIKKMLAAWENGEKQA